MKGQHACPNCGVYLYNSKHTVGDRLYRTTEELFEIVECRGCGLLRLDPRPSESELHKYYPDRYWAQGKTRKGATGFYRRFVLRDHFRFIKKTFKQMGLKKARILDLGCGGGDLLALLRKKQHSAVGMDIAQSALRSAAELNVPGVCASYRQAPFGPDTFDVVTMFHMLEHIPDPDQAIIAVREMLRPSGRLIIQIPNADCMQYGIFGKRWVGLDPPRHLYAYRRQDLEDFLTRNGFTVLRRKYFSWRDNAPSLATTIAPWLDPMARRVRRPKRNKILRMGADLMYFFLTMACWPFAIFEAMFRRGATIMVDAEKNP